MQHSQELGLRDVANVRYIEVLEHGLQENAHLDDCSLVSLHYIHDNLLLVLREQQVFLSRYESIALGWHLDASVWILLQILDRED